MRIIIDGHGRIDRQAMAVERLKTIDMTPAGGRGRPGLGRRMARRVRPGARPVPALETALDADMGKELSGDAR